MGKSLPCILTPDSRVALLSFPAYAKINLTLEVLGRRDDGYHDVASVMQTIDLRDSLSFQLEEEVKLLCSIPELASPANLVLQAAELLQEETRCGKGAVISLDKGIPPASGLGGGSSDAATTLKALNELWDLNLSRDKLVEIGSRLGSDVVFFLYGGTALAERRGEKITVLPALSTHWVVLLRPPVVIANKTREMYARLSPSQFNQGQFTRKIVELLHENGKVVSPLLYNVFDSLAFSLFPVLEGYRTRFLRASAAEVHLSGSGPTLFTLVDSRAEGEDIRRRLSSEGLETYLAQTL